MFKTFLKILYFLTAILIFAIFIIDLLSFYSQISLTPIAYTRELVILVLVFLWYEILKRKLHFDELTIDQNLTRLVILIIANYVIFFTSKIIFNPSYDNSVFPPIYQNAGAIFVSSCMTITTALTIVPALLIMKQLIFYRRKRFTALNFNIFLVALAINALSVFLTQGSVGRFVFSSETLANDISMILAIIPIIILSFRNEWISYLPRKKKIIYFLFGIPLYAGIALLFDMVYKTPLPAYSLSMAAVSYTVALFLIIYGAIALAKLLLYLPTARVFDRKIKELNSLYDLARRLNSETSQRTLLPLITQATSEYLESDSTWLALYNEKNQQFYLASSQNLEESEITNFPLNQLEGLNLTILNKKEPIIIQDLSHNRQYKSLIHWKKNARTIVGAPMFSNRGQLMGIIYATKMREYNFDIDDVTLLEGIANQAAIALENVQLLEESIERGRLEQELKIAREVQLNLLPQKIPYLSNIEIDTFCRTAYEVGGDYYDFFTYRDGKTGFIVGDVSGKGTSAALYMAEFKGIIQTLAKIHDSPCSLAVATNTIIYPNIERRSFISAIFGKIDEHNNSVTFARAGHPHPLLHSDQNGQPAFILSKGIGIGLDSGQIFNNIIEEKTVPLGIGDSLIFFTDGVTEARNISGEEFTDDRLLTVLSEYKPKSALEIKEKISRTIEQFCKNAHLHDDLTFVILKHR
jgi:sigma-B regulation protein RsbU (phosphoserine phosphatase)